MMYKIIETNLTNFNSIRNFLEQNRIIAIYFESFIDNCHNLEKQLFYDDIVDYHNTFIITFRILIKSIETFYRNIFS